MQDEHECTAHLGAGGSEMHRRTTWHNDMSAPSAPDLLALWSFEARFAGQGIPGLRARMTVCGRRHARRENGLHVLRGVFRIRAHWERADFRDALATGRTPSGHVNREQPYLSQRLHNGSARSLGRLRRDARWIRVQVPEDRPLWQLP